MTQRVQAKGLKEATDAIEAKRRYILRVIGASSVKLLVSPQTVSRALDIARAKLTNYPPPPPRSRYQRTRRLYRNWKSEIETNQVIIANEAKDPIKGTFYGEYVFGKFQPDFHKETGWNKETDSITREIFEPVVQGIRKRFVEGLARIES